MHYTVPLLERRLSAYEEFKSIHSARPRREVVNLISSQYGVAKTTVYQWYKGTSPLGNRAGSVEKIPELLYVLGTLLGDGCEYFWKNHFQVWLVGEMEFASKYAEKLSFCLGRHVNYYKYGSKKAWFVRVDNAELYFLFRAVRKDISQVEGLVEAMGGGRGWQEFIQGFFDAEGCVKIIGGKERKTPKACLDFCNTDLEVLQTTKQSLKKELAIESAISAQAARGTRKTCYHLRIYGKDGIAKFLVTTPTTKLTAWKIPLVRAWLEKGSAGKVLLGDFPEPRIRV